MHNNEIKELDARLAQLQGKRLSVYLFSILLMFGALGFFGLSNYVYREFYEPNLNIFDYGNFSRVWSPIFITIALGLALVIEAVKNIKSFFSKIKEAKEKKKVLMR